MAMASLFRARVYQGLLGSRAGFARTLSLTTVYVQGQQISAISQRPAPEVYTTIPPQPKVEKPGQLERWQVEKYFDQGFLVVPNFFASAELEPVKQAVEECVDILANKLYNGGKITDKCEKAGFYERLTLIECQFKGATVLLHKNGYLPNGFRDLWSNDRLLNVIEQFIGPNVAGHPVWNLRTKTPRNELASVPWHQDNAYFDPDALYTFMPTAWIPLLDATPHNGCLQVHECFVCEIIPRGHRIGSTLTHTCCPGDTWHVVLAESEIEKTYNIDIKKAAVTCEVPFGGVVFLNNCIPHRSLENYSDKIRWSLDLRWQDPSKSVGFHGLKDTVLMRKEGDPNYKIDWEEFSAVDRNKLQAEEVGYTESEEDFDTTIHGPWMLRWEITHHNRHTAALKNASRSLHKA